MRGLAGRFSEGCKSSRSALGSISPLNYGINPKAELDFAACGKGWGFLIVGFLWSVAPRAWGCQTALAGARLCARVFLRAYLALHPHARLCFLSRFPVLYRCIVEIEGVGCSSEKVSRFF